MTQKVGLVVFTLLCSCNAMGYGRHSRSHHKSSFNDGYNAATFKEMNDAEAGVDLGDAKMTDLTNSIEGVFQLDPAKVAAAQEALEAVKTQKPALNKESPHIVPVPAKTAAKLPTPHGHPEAGAAKKEAPKPVAAAASAKVETKPVVAKVETKPVVAKVTDKVSPHIVPVPAKPTVKLPAPASHKEGPQTKKAADAAPKPVVAIAKPAAKAAPLPDPKGAKPKVSLAKSATKMTHDQSVGKVPWNAVAAQLAERKEKVFEYGATASHSKGFLESRPQVPKQVMEQDHGAVGDEDADVAEQAALANAALARAKAADHSVVSTAMDTDSANQADMAPPGVNWFSPFTFIASWLYKESPSMLFSKFMVARKVKAVPAAVITPPKPQALVLAKQDSQRTAQSTLEDSQHIFEISDTWGQMEKEDTAREQQVRGLDVAERRRAETAEPAHKASAAELKGRHGVPMSGFWSKLEKEDNSIEKTVQSDDLVKYAELTQAQDVRVNDASDQLALGKLHIGDHDDLKRNNDDTRIAIHEPWLAHEKKDRAVERQIHDEPNLQMLQLKHQHQHK